MKNLFTLIIAFMSIALPMTTEASEDKPSSVPVAMDIHPIKNKPNRPVHRAPICIYVEAWYDVPSETITILYDGETSGEAFLYRDGELIDNSSEINTTFTILGSGFYTIEIKTESWTATGNIEI